MLQFDRQFYMTREENITMSEIDYKAVQIDVLEFDSEDVIVTSGCEWQGVCDKFSYDPSCTAQVPN